MDDETEEILMVRVDNILVSTLRRWRIWHRVDISEYLALGTLKGRGASEHATIWAAPSTGTREERCLTLTIICKINNIGEPVEVIIRA